MKKIIGSLIISGCVLVGCQSPEDLEENWTEYIQEGSENLESYSSDTDIRVSVSLGPDNVVEEDELKIVISIVGDLDKGYSVEENVAGLSQEVFFEGNDFYLKENENWTHYPDAGPIEYAPWYPNVVESLIEIEDLMEASHSGDVLVLSYEGNDREVWEAFEEEFSLSISGVSEENITMTLEATMDDSTYYLQDLSLNIVGEESDGDMEIGRVTIIVEAQYTDHDTVDLTDVEEEIANDVE
ncbi:hypothetical protein GCM10008932_11530 [Alkalibacterium iburiense]|uniref:Lipoprotein n=1 Tax=Alkalibacterium iburiense TaxID=290589 RepID=A0ABN0XC85_9LACT